MLSSAGPGKASPRRRPEPYGEALAHRRKTRPATTDPAAGQSLGCCDADRAHCADPPARRRHARRGSARRGARGRDPGRGKGRRGSPPPEQPGSTWTRADRGHLLHVIVAGDAGLRGIRLRSARRSQDRHRRWRPAGNPRDTRYPGERRPRDRDLTPPRRIAACLVRQPDQRAVEGPDIDLKRGPDRRLVRQPDQRTVETSESGLPGTADRGLVRQPDQRAVEEPETEPGGRHRPLLGPPAGPGTCSRPGSEPMSPARRATPAGTPEITLVGATTENPFLSTDEQLARVEIDTSVRAALRDCHPNHQRHDRDLEEGGGRHLVDRGHKS
jgi:hypothetical protein